MKCPSQELIKAAYNPLMASKKIQEFKQIRRDPAAEAERLRAGRSLASRLIEAMATKGVTIELFGSIQTGSNVFANSDVDLLVTDCGGIEPALIWYELGLLSDDQPIEVDVTFLDLVPEDSRDRIQESRLKRI
jgi:predicted nucleotidyltransferase